MGLFIGIGVFILVAVGIIITRSKADGKLEYTLYNSKYSDRELELVRLINGYRDSSVELNDFLSLKAEEHSLYCVREGKPSHDNLGERLTEITQNSYMKRMGEIVTYGYKDPKSLLKSLKRSEPHNQILTGNYTQVGISIKESGKTKMYTTIIFAR